MDAVRDRPTFLRVMIVLAATVVVLVGMRLAAPVLNTVLFALVFAYLVSPIFSWSAAGSHPPGPHHHAGRADHTLYGALFRSWSLDRQV